MLEASFQTQIRGSLSDLACTNTIKRMDNLFNFHSISFSIIKILLCSFVGYFLHRRKILTDESMSMLIKLIVSVFLPSLIFAKVTRDFSPRAYPEWWIMPLAAVSISFLGMLLARLTYGFLQGTSVRREYMVSVGFHNCGYLPMTLIVFTFKGAMVNEFLVLIFLYILGFNLLVWSFAPFFVAGKKLKHFKLSSVLNPPVLAMITSFLWVFIIGQKTVPKIISEPLDLLGKCTFGVAMISLGGFLSKYQVHRVSNLTAVFGGVFTKLILLPAIIFLILLKFPISVKYKFILFLETIVPSAVSLVVIGTLAKGNNKFLTEMIFYSHIAAIITMPLWIYIFSIMF